MNTFCLQAFAWTWLISTPLAIAADEPAGVDPNDFSHTHSITLLLADAVRGRPLPGQGLQHICWERDGQTAGMNVEDTPCRCLNFPDQSRSMMVCSPAQATTAAATIPAIVPQVGELRFV